VPLHSDAQHLLHRYLYEVRCPDHQPAVGSQEEQSPLLMGRQVASEGRSWLPGVQAQSLRKRLKQLGSAAAQALRAAERTVDLSRSAALQQMAQQVEQVTPYQLRHSLARRLLKNGAILPEVQRLLDHSRLTTTGMYLQPSAADLRQAIEQAGI
jgi:site-specific recombinase XerC